jgi:hypothetical protein
MEVPDNMKKVLFVGSIVVFSMLVPELFSGSCQLLADPAGCCMQRPNTNAPWKPNVCCVPTREWARRSVSQQNHDRTGSNDVS